MIRLGVLGSTRGTHLLTLIEAIDGGRLDASIACVVSNKEDALILSRGRDHGLPSLFVPSKGLSRDAFDEGIHAHLKAHTVDIVVLVGYMRILSAAFVRQWQDRIINIHPSLLPKHAGLMDLAVHQAVLDAGDTESGCTAHLVTEAVDEGPLLVQARCPVMESDTAEDLKARVQTLEADTLIDAIKSLGAHL